VSLILFSNLHIVLSVTTWRRNIVTNNPPVYHALGISANNGSYMYYAGGKATANGTDTFYSNLVRLDTSTSPPQWTNLGNFPATIAMTHGSYDAITSKLFFPGGNTEYLGDVFYTYSLKTGQTSTVSMST